MSSIDKLLIQGIRCYGPGEDQRVLITFKTPLTVIFGANGTGKTTVIECLKYITTGDMPPNSKGGAFVHDPNIAREREVKGQVKLKFKDIAKRQVTCSRSLQSTQKMVAGVKKIETKTIDSSMEKIGEDGQKRKITSRCAEVDTEMCRHLGVSKAVLNNVIFCHQEDSNWPLSEGKALKTKFDEIFASTRYTKALENVKKFRQEQDQECKVFKVDMQHLQKQKEKAAELQADLSETQDKVKESQTSVSYIDSQLKPTEENLQRLDDMYTEFAEKEKSIAGLKSKKQQLEHNQRQLQDKIGHAVTASIEEVQRNCKDHKSQLELEKKELQESEGLIRELEIERRELDDERDKLLKQQGRLRLRAEDNQQSIKDRDNLVKRFSMKHAIKVKSSGNLSQSDAEDFLSSITQKRKSWEQAYRSEMEDFNAKKDDVQEKLDNMKLEQAKYNQSKEIKSKQIEENKKKCKEIDKELRRIAGLNTTTVEAAERQLQEAEGNLKEFQEHTDIASLESEYNSLQKQKKAMDAQVSRLQEELDKLSRQAAQRGALETLRKKKEEAEVKVNGIMAEVERDLELIFDIIPTAEELSSKLTAEKVSQERKVKAAEDKVRKARESKARLVYKTESLNKELARQKKREQDLQQKIDRACDGKDYQSLVEEVQKDIESTQDDIAAVQGSAPFFKKCVEKVRTSKKCPICTRGFDSESDIDKVVNTLTSRMNESVPRIIPKLQERLREQQQKQKNLQQLKPSIDELEKLSSQEIPMKETELSSTNQELQSAEKEFKKSEMEYLTCKESLGQIQAVEPKVSQLSYRNQDLKKLEQQVAMEEAKLGDVGTAGRSHIVVRREHQNALQEQGEIERKRERKGRDITDTRQQLIELEKSVQNFRGKKLEITESMRKREGLVEQRAGLVSAIITLEKEVKDIVKKTTTVQDKLTTMMAKKESILKEKEDAESISRAKVNDIVKDERNLDALIQKISSYNASGDEKALEKCENKLSTCQGKTDELTQKRKELQITINQLREQLANAEIRLRKFEDSIQFLNQQKEIGSVVAKIRQLEAELREHGVEDYDGEYNRLKNKADQFRKQRAHLEGKKLGLEDEMRRIQRDLDSDLYRDADTRYLHRAADIKALEVTTSDLDKFYKALDRAITRYHKIKMDEVNKIVQELWIKIYRGGDIDNIEIESSDDSEGSAISKRRVYNYRVVMDKGGAKLDMRGRCSAGQKVLASLVIRLALAETFCLNCGVLTLDEPTTNLDSENVEALAQALADIIASRREQSNFQLVVITHDQDFVNMMGRSDHVDDYLLLKREGESTKLQVCKF